MALPVTLQAGKLLQAFIQLEVFNQLGEMRHNYQFPVRGRSEQLTLSHESVGDTHISRGSFASKTSAVKFMSLLPVPGIYLIIVSISQTQSLPWDL